MRRTYSTITPSVVHHFTRSILETTLGFQGYKHSVTLRQLLDLLLLVAATTRTLSALATRCFSFSDELARQAVGANLTTTDALTRRLTDALHAVAAFSRRDRRRLGTVGIDLHYVPYYGSRDTPGDARLARRTDPNTLPAHATYHTRQQYTYNLHRPLKLLARERL